MNSILSAVVAATLALAAVEASAEGTPGERQVALEIESKTLAEALDQWAERTGFQIVVQNWEMAKKLAAPRLKGTFSAHVALEKLLEGTPLTFTWLTEQAVTIRERTSTLPAVWETSGEPIHVAKLSNENWEAPAPRIGSDSVEKSSDGSSAPSGQDRGSSGNLKRNGLEEIVVAGSRLKVHGPDEGAQDVRTYGRDEIQRRGATTVSSFLNTLPSVSTATTEVSFQHVDGGSTVQLRGLPVGGTLVLINGHRIQASGRQSRENFFDLNNIPLAAVERIDVVASGSSAVYGSDAIAGVVNIVLRTNFDGFEVSGRYGTADNTDESLSSLAWGHSWDRGNISFVGNYQSRKELEGANRSLTASNDYRGYGGPNNNLPVCNPGNVFFPNGFSFDGVTLAEFAAVPVTPDGTPTVEEFAATAGTTNECALSSPFVSLVPKTRRAGGLLSATYDLTPRVSLFSEVLYSHTQQSTGGFPVLLFGFPGFQAFTLGELNPYNPFGTRVGLASQFSDYPTGAVATTDFFRPLIGVKGSIGASWEWELAGISSRDDSRIEFPNSIVDGGALQGALDSADPSQAINPFSIHSPADPALLQSFFSDGLYKYSTRSQLISGFLRGAAADLPAGPVDLVLGSEYTSDELHSNIVRDAIAIPGSSTDSRHTLAMFGEARVPIVSGPETTSRDKLAVTAAIRHDRYSDFGNATNSAFGAEWRPWEALLVRGSYADAFKAPSLYNLYTPQQSVPSGLLDPVTGEIVFAPVLFGGNPDLLPEKGRSRSLGVLFSSESLPNLRLGATYWNVEQVKTIQNLDPQAIVDAEAVFQTRVVRDPTGAIALIDATALNFGSVDVDGIDYQIGYVSSTGLGDFSSSIDFTQTRKYEARMVPGAVAADRAGRADQSGWSPEWKGMVSLGWTSGPYTVNAYGRYVSEYEDYGSTRKIGNFWLFDTNFRFSLMEVSRFSGSPFEGAYVELGASNVFDQQAQYSNYLGSLLGYDPTQADIRGRFVYLQLGLQL